MTEFYLPIAVLAAVSTLLPPAALDSYPAPSPDGNSVLLVSSRDGSESIWVARFDGSAPHKLLDGGTLGSAPGGPAWSPDGTKFTFAMRPSDAQLDEEADIYIVDADGSHVKRLTHTPGDDSHPHWSADGKRIFFNSARATPDLSAEWGKQWIDIYSMAADGSDVRRITDCRTICTYPVPSPDGQWIVHRKTSDTPGFDWELKAILRNSEVVVTSIDGKIVRNLSQSPAYDGWPTWSKDGRWVIFASNRDGAPTTGQLYAVRADGSGMRRLTSGSLSKVQPWPSADSKWLLFAERVEDGSGAFGRISKIPLELP